MNTTLDTLVEIINKIKSKLIIILSISILIAILYALNVRQEKETFEAYSKIFPLSINKAGGSSPLDAIKSQFGISDKTDYDKIYNINELVKSKRILHNVVNAKTSNKKYKRIADWIIDDDNSNKRFYEKKVNLNKLDSSLKTYTSAMIVTKNIEVKSDKTDFTTITTKTYNKDLSKELNEQILIELSGLYITMVTEKPRNDLARIGVLRDSLKDELYSVERAIAGFQDANQLSIKYSNNIPQAKLMRTRAELDKLYETTATAYQNARFKLLSESPIFQVLDKPGPPYNSVKPSAKNAGILAFIMSFIILSFWFIRKIFGKLIIEELAKS